jgi:nucleoside phosphorylase
MILVVAATERELAGAAGVATLVCGIGPVEAAAATAGGLARGRRPDLLLHVGIAGARGIPVPQLVIGSEAVYEDALAGGLVAERERPDPRLVDAAQRALPEALVLPIGTSARVGGTSSCEVEAMEGFAVLRAARLTGVPAVEVRAVSNEIDEPDRSRWRFDDALDALSAALPRLLAELDG